MDKIKKIIREYLDKAEYGIFFTHNIVGDYMETIYVDNKYRVDICYDYGYFEIFGLNKNQQEEIRDYYNLLFEQRYE